MVRWLEHSDCRGSKARVFTREEGRHVPTVEQLGLSEVVRAELEDMNSGGGKSLEKGPGDLVEVESVGLTSGVWGRRSKGMLEFKPGRLEDSVVHQRGGVWRGGGGKGARLGRLSPVRLERL